MPSDIIVRLDETAQIKIDVDFDEEANIISSIAYGLIAACWNMNLRDRALGIARYCLGSETLTSIRELALFAVKALRQDPEDALHLATLSGLHTIPDETYTLTIALFIEAGRGFEEFQALTRFYSAAIEAQKGIFDVAPIHYSLANALASFGDIWGAIAHFNIARKLRPQYLDTQYYLDELAGPLFHCKRYRIAAKLYRKSHEIAPSPHSAFRLADASFFAGDFETAEPLFRTVLNMSDEVLRAESLLKLGSLPFICPEPGKPSFSITALLERSQNFFERRSYESALLSGVIAAFVAGADEDIWASCILLSLLSASEALFHATSVCAVRSCGGGAHKAFRQRFAEYFPTEILDQLDAGTLEMKQKVREWGKIASKVRIFRDRDLEVYQLG